MLTGKTPDEPEIQLLSLALRKHGIRACVRSNPGYGQSWRLGVKCSSSHSSVFAGRIKHKHAQTHDEVSAEPELSYNVMGTGSLKLLESKENKATKTFELVVSPRHLRTVLDSVLVILPRSVVRLKPPGGLVPDSLTTYRPTGRQILVLAYLTLPAICQDLAAPAVVLLRSRRQHHRKGRSSQRGRTVAEMPSATSVAAGAFTDDRIHDGYPQVVMLYDFCLGSTAVHDLAVSLSLVAIDKPLQTTVHSGPHPGSGEALIRVQATALLALDQNSTTSAFNIASRLPLVLGIDLVAIVVDYGVSIAPGNVPPPVGTLVLFEGNFRRPHAGGLAPYVLADPRFLISPPVATPSLQAAALITNPFTVALSLFHSSGLGFPFPGIDPTFEYWKTHVIVLGVGTTVGTFIVRLAAIAGIGTIITTSSKTSFETL
ncbi:hypothetical protein CSAL01_07545 [Colletotrichum salicis]|uniref:Uncharacterized protein n=1 Tax=Colletotrichum salicis TaxID=1209931 RepID=A0A135V4V5_9PEZI|nr:hypothetical protein CSAL01_07545 [Colletotrichum salicis]